MTEVAPAMPRGRAFWPAQLLPPLAILALWLRDDGAGFFFLSAMLLPVAFVSLLSLAWKLVRRRDAARLVRPALALLLSVGTIAYAKASLAGAHAAVAGEARRLQARCSADACPDPWVFGTSADDAWGRVPSPPTHLRWPVVVARDGDGFAIELVHGPDFRTRWEGGPSRPVRVFDVADGDARPRAEEPPR